MQWRKDWDTGNTGHKSQIEQIDTQTKQTNAKQTKYKKNINIFFVLFVYLSIYLVLLDTKLASGILYNRMKGGIAWH